MRSECNKNIFLKNLILRLIICLTGNSLFLYPLIQKDVELSPFSYFFIHFILIILNGYLYLKFFNLVKQRINYLQQNTIENSKIKNVKLTLFLLYAFPMVCLFVVLSLFKEEENKNWSLKKYLPRSIAYSFSVTLLITVMTTMTGHTKPDTSEFIFEGLIKYQVLPTLRNVFNISREASIVFYSKTFVDNICDKGREKYECVHEYNMKKLKEMNSSATGVILSIASEAIFILKSKNEIISNDNNNVNKADVKYAKTLARYNLDWFQYLCREKSLFQNHFPYGVYLLSGSIEMPFLMLVHGLIDSRFIQVGGNKIGLIIKEVKKKSPGREIASYLVEMNSLQDSNCFKRNMNIANYFSNITGIN